MAREHKTIYNCDLLSVCLLDRLRVWGGGGVGGGGGGAAEQRAGGG